MTSSRGTFAFGNQAAARPSVVRRRRRIACSGRARDVLDYIDREMVRRPLDFPFPVDGDFIAHLRLPHDGLSRREAERLKLYIDCLVTG